MDLFALQEMAMASAVPKPIPVRTAGLQTVPTNLAANLTPFFDSLNKAYSLTSIASTF